MRILVVIILIVIIFVQKTNCQPITYINENDSLYVFTFSGLNLRTEPNANAQSIEVIEFGEKLIVKKLHDYEKIENRKGFWAEVSYKRNTGYVFTGYTSKLQLPDFENPNYSCDPNMCFIQWMEAIYSEKEILLKQTIVPKIHGGIDEDKGFPEETFRIFEDGTRLTIRHEYEYTEYSISTYKLNLNDILNYMNCINQLISKNIDCKRDYGHLKFNSEINIDSNGNSIIDGLISVFAIKDRIICNLYHP